MSEKTKDNAPDSVNSIDWLGIVARTFWFDIKVDDCVAFRRGLGLALNGLGWQESMVVILRARGMKLRECGDLLCVKAERVRQIEAKAYRKLRHPHLYEKFSRYITDSEFHDA